MSIDISEFDLHRLLQTVFHPEQGERVGVFIDLSSPENVTDFRFLEDPDLQIQSIAYHHFYRELSDNKERYPFGRIDFFAYQMTGGSNLDLPATVWAPDGKEQSLRTVLGDLDIVLFISTHSATAPITALARDIGFRGATLHGLNEIILNSGLARDYVEVSEQAERLRLAMTRSDWFEIEFQVLGRECTLHLDLEGQEAQKSHGLCYEPGEIANLPAGEVYFVPADANGAFPMLYPNGTIALAHVQHNRIESLEILEGDAATVEAHRDKISRDPATAEIGELGLGTQDLPWSGRDIQDEKVLGTVHVATGRSDHLGGHITPDMFNHPENASHDDILFAPHKTPKIDVVEVRMHKDGATRAVIHHYQPTKYLKSVLD